MQPRPGDEALLAGITGQLRGTATGSRVLALLDRGQAQVQFLDEAEMKRRNPNSEAVYDSNNNTIFLSRDGARADAAVAAIALAHEATHWVHDPLIDAAKQQGMRRLELSRDPQALAKVMMVEHALATETEAHMVEARVARELGFRNQISHPAMRKDGSYATHAQTWAALQAGSQYNPTSMQVPRHWYQRVLS